MRLRVKPLKTKIMNKLKKVVLKNCEPVFCNPEDKFTDLMNDGWELNDVLLELMEEAVVSSKLDKYWPKWSPSMLTNKGNGKWKVLLERDN